ncbi:MAG: hypothetical protein CEE42_03100 [Promethearchaeota archaeon Loki_b31]|nr:MAG: hypothetical protein CEE42_03100 [Candidatus Lokiarchaeota archaeon Loki_b31]
MKDKKIIAYKNERTKKIAFNLRRLIVRAVMDEWMKLLREKKNKPMFECVRIENVRSDLYGALQASICECSSCRDTDDDMEYNAALREWYCTQCAQEYRDYYHKEKEIYGDHYGKVHDDEDFYESFL